jgi:hypothetical protein
LNSDQEDTGVAQNDKNYLANAVAKWVKLWISNGTGNEEEREVEICLNTILVLEV